MATAAKGNVSVVALKIVLAIFGALVVFTALNRAFGGIATLGWQGPTDFFQVVNEPAFLVQDSHTRFLGGVWAGTGLMMLVSPINLRAARPVLNFIVAVIFLGGLARFTSLNFGLVFGPDVLLSLTLELVLMPVLYFWLRSVSENA